MRKSRKTGCRNLAAITFLLTVYIVLPLYAQDPLQPDPSDNWEIRLMPYFYFLSMDAEATVGGNSRSLSANVDLSFDDIIDSLNFGAMGRVEAWNGPWGLTFDGLFMNLSASESFQVTRGVIERFQREIDVNLDADVRLGTADFALAYRLYENQFGKINAQQLAFEPYGGLRYGYLREKIDLDVNIAGVGSAGTTLGTSEDWIEPFVGGRVIWDLNKKWALNIRGDAGGFGIGSASNLTWQLAGGVDYKISNNMIFNAGYRYIELDYSRGSGLDELGVDLRAKGPYLGLTIQF